jgi:alkanesulfonate monooxygenase SsuD/methylene tetrahydromethanopterin reductase-like flavin-dependent oxidoreductase (luciferase family)
MDIGLTLPNRGVMLGIISAEELIQMAEIGEQSNEFRSVWVGDSLLGKPRLESISLLAAIAARTQRIRLGVACMASFVIRDPILFAYQWASLDVIAQGRTIFVGCTGIIGQDGGQKEAEQYGVSNRDRAKRLEEWTVLLHRLWTEDDVSFEGEYFQCSGITIEPKPVARPHPPIWIASNTFGSPTLVARSLDRVARLADGWETSICSVNELENRFARIKKRTEGHGRDPDLMVFHLYHNINVNSDPATALAETKKFLDAYYSRDHPPEWVKCWTAAGTPRQCAEHLAKYAPLGVEEITIRATSYDQFGQLDRIVNEVLPLVKEIRAEGENNAD